RARHRHARGPRRAARRPALRPAHPGAAGRGGLPRLISARALHGLPEVRDGDDLAALLAGLDVELRDTDVVAVAHKVVSKAEGRTVALDRVSPSPHAQALAREHDKDARVMQVVLDESERIVR